MSSDETVVRELDDIGMVQIRGDLSDASFRKAVAAVIALDVPEMGKMIQDGNTGLAWMSTDELLGFTPDPAAMTDALQTALSDHHHLVLDVSDQRVIFELQGPGWRDIVAKGMPVDFHVAAFGPGDFRRTRLGQVAAAVWCIDPMTARATVGRSVGGFAAEWLRVAALPSQAEQVF